MELLGSKAAAIDGHLRDGSAFSGDPVESLSQVLSEHGHHYLGKEILTSGVTGEPLEAYIYFGPIYYQRLKHMVIDKVEVHLLIIEVELFKVFFQTIRIARVCRVFASPEMAAFPN